MLDEEFLAAFEECRLPREQWTHEAHIRMAWLYLRRRPLVEVIPIVRAGIYRYNDAVIRKPEAYHESITLAMLALIDRAMEAGGPEETYPEFRERVPELLDRKLSTLLRHYRRETLYSDRARLTFVEPDRIPLPRGEVGRGG